MSEKAQRAPGKLKAVSENVHLIGEKGAECPAFEALNLWTGERRTAVSEGFEELRV